MRVASPSFGGETFLTGVRAISRRDAWSVGTSDVVHHQIQYVHTLALRWNGRGWHRVGTPHPGVDSWLAAVAGWRKDLWAVGRWTRTGLYQRGLILHWNGRRWSRVRAPGLVRMSRLTSLSAVARGDVWAAGDVFNDTTGYQPLLLHWNGARWHRAATPELSATSEIDAASATSDRDVWLGGQGLLHWDGSSLAQVMSNTQPVNALDAFSRTDAWLASGCDGCAPPAVMMHWDGARWSPNPTPNPGDQADALDSIGGSGSADLWAVGTYLSSSIGHYRTLILHWDGTSWAPSS